MSTAEPPNAGGDDAVAPPNGDAFDVAKLFPNTDAEVVAVCANPPPPPPPKADDPKTEPAADCCGEPKLVVPPNSDPLDVGLAAALLPNTEVACTALFAREIL